MNILFLAPDLSGSHGWSQYTVSVVRALKNLGVGVTLVCAKNSPPLDDFSLYPILPSVVPLERHSLLKLAVAVRRVRRWGQGYQGIHATVESYAPLAWASGMPYWITGHGTYVNLPRMRRFPVNHLYRRAFSSATSMVCVSHYTAQIARHVVPELSVRVILNAVDVTRFAHIPLAQDNQHPLVLSTGGVKKRKGTLEMVQAMAIVREAIPHVRYVVLGRVPDDAYTARVRAEIERLGLQETVELRGFVSDEELQAWYGRATIFAMPSMNNGYHFEGFGLVHLEASACGLPVIGTRGCGIEDAIDHEKTGLLVNQATIHEELPQALLYLLNHPEIAQAMGKAGKLKAQARSWQTVAQDLVQLYQDALNQR